MQNIYNLVYREEEREMLPLCRDQNVGVIPWSPLARGFLGGNRPRGSSGETERARTDEYTGKLGIGTDADYAVLDHVNEAASRHGVSAAQIALAWVLSKPGITAPIIGASKMPHLDEAIAAMEIELDDDEIKTLEADYALRPIAEHM